MREAFYLIIYILPVLLFGKADTLIHSDTSSIQADTSARNREIVVEKIFIVGNKKTKPEIILREISVNEGDKFNRLALDEKLKQDRNLVYNTNLFDEVTIQVLEKESDVVNLVIQVEERWYIYPAPIFRIADRNLMDWIINRGGELNRFNYGLKLDHYNFRGRAEQVRFIGQLGFERQLFLRYSIPYIEKTQKHGLSFDLIYNERENMTYTTRDHLQTFLEDDEINRRIFRSKVTYSYRPSYYSFHYISLGYLNGLASDTITQLNPNYFGNGNNHLQNFSMEYSYKLDKRNNRNFPTNGYLFRATGSKVGLGIFGDVNLTSLHLRYSKYYDLGNNFYLANGIVGYTSFPRNQPYFYYYGLGYDDFYVRGFELDVVEGYQYLLSKNSFRKLLFSTEQDISRFMPIKQFNRIPFKFYAKFFFDAGWVNNYPQYEINNRLTNTVIYSAGLGIDFVTLYDLVLRFEYSYNSEDDLNFAINVKAGI